MLPRSSKIVPTGHPKTRKCSQNTIVVLIFTSQPFKQRSPPGLPKMSKIAPQLAPSSMLGHVGATLAPSWRQVGQKERTTTSQDRPTTLQDHPKMSQHHAKTAQVAQRPPKACFWKGLGKVFSGMLVKTGSAALAVRPLNIFPKSCLLTFGILFAIITDYF